MNYDYYIALDWAQTNMAIAISKKGFSAARVFEEKASVKRLKYLLNTLPGKKILTIEESTTAQWLWVELNKYVDEMIICDPYHNYLLSSGPKNDRLDAAKLLELLCADLLKPVFHSGHRFMEYRKLVSSYEDIIKTGVHWKNRRCAILRAQGKTKKSNQVNGDIDCLTLDSADRYIQLYNEHKNVYHQIFLHCIRGSKTLRALQSIPGIGIVGAIKIAAIVVDPSRFPSKGHFWAYCGLVKHHKMSGGRSYGKRSPRFNRTLKSVFKTAALACCHGRGNSSMKEYYLDLLRRGMPAHNARHKVSRKIATIALITMQKGERYNRREVLKQIGGRSDDIICADSRA